MATSCESTGYDSETGSVGIRLFNAAGGILASGPAGNVFSSPWSSAMVGNFSMLSVPDAQLCEFPAGGTDNSWAGQAIFAGPFGVGCSYETRARVAQARGASGVLYKGDLHSPFDWDGSAQTGLAPAQTSVRIRGGAGIINACRVTGSHRWVSAGTRINIFKCRTLRFVPIMYPL